MLVIKKDGTKEEFNLEKIRRAVGKAVARALIDDFDYDSLFAEVNKLVEGKEEISVHEIQNTVIYALNILNPGVAKTYSDYRNYKQDFIRMLDSVYKASQTIRFIGDKENANSDSALVATKRCLIFNELNKRLYRKFFMNQEEIQACRDGYIYIHDQSSRLDTFNCCIFDMETVMTGGFEMGNVWYNEPKWLDTAFDVMGDIILATASQQYGKQNTAVFKLH